MTSPLENKEKLPSIKFSVDGSLIHRLGAESVSDPIIAVAELVKNSYDDDAEHVTVILRNLKTGDSSITIVDDGNGMTEEHLANRWMRIATNCKVREPISPIFKRHRLGKKGVGRFAVENLSQRTVITSFPRDSAEGYEVTFEWDNYRPDTDLSQIPNDLYSFKKDLQKHGLQIYLQRLPYKWLEADVRRLLLFLKALTPPTEKPVNFEVAVDTDEFDQLKGVIDSGFLSKAVFVFDAKLSKTGETEYRFHVPSKKKTFQKNGKMEDLSCGPIHLKCFFYYRVKSKLAAYGIKIPAIEDFKRILDDYAGVKIYRDGIRLSGFGDLDEDWAGLDAMSKNDPSVIPSQNQLIAMVGISSQENPEISETTTRENLIRNKSYLDMVAFVRDSISVFAQLRGEFEKKRQRLPRRDETYIEKSIKKTAEIENRKPLLDLETKFPEVFYDRLVDEINECSKARLANATLVLSRKLVENLLYNLFEYKFPKEIDLRFNPDLGHAYGLSKLIENLTKKKNEFDKEQQDLIENLLQRIHPFKRNANSKAHKVIEYLKTMEELDDLEIPEIVEIELKLIKKAKS